MQDFLSQFDVNTLINVLLLLLTIIAGAAASYFKANTKLQEKCSLFIAEAEETYKDVTKAGGLKFTWVVDRLFHLVPAPLRLIITRSMIETIVQNTFDSIETYAKRQLDDFFDGKKSGVDTKVGGTE